jgi:hypothetical protein
VAKALAFSHDREFADEVFSRILECLLAVRLDRLAGFAPLDFAAKLEIPGLRKVFGLPKSFPVVWAILLAADRCRTVPMIAALVQRRAQTLSY